MKRFLSLLAGKIIINLSKLAGNNGSSLPGLFGSKISKNLLKNLSAEIPGEIICVCGTNGKTTTNNMIDQVVSADGTNIVCNKVGANMYYGVLTAFIAKAPLFGKMKSKHAVIEIDEASTIKIFKEMQPSYLIITNLFRDQLDRYGEIDIIINKLSEAIESLNESTTLILNGDDPLVASMGFKTKKRVIYFGIKKADYYKGDISEVKEGRYCLFCGSELKYEYYHYSQLGKYECPNCAFKRPPIDYEASEVQTGDGIKFDLNYKDGIYPFNIPYKGFYNIYNVLACGAVVEEMGLGIETAEIALKKFKTQVGRMENFYISKPVFLNLSKNPAGFNQAIETVLEEKEDIDILLGLNDNDQDGRDVSWIWDGQFEKLDQKNLKNLYIVGTRPYDMALRLKYGNVDTNKIKIYTNINKGVSMALNGRGKKLYILVNYTVLFQIQKILKEKEKRGKKLWKRK